MKKCKVCGKEFSSKIRNRYGEKKYCSKECYEKIQSQMQTQYTKNFKINHPNFYKEKHEYQKLNYPERNNAWKNDYKKRKSYCELCGSTDKLEFHHIDYITHSGITVCFNCHRYKIHKDSYKHQLKINEVQG